jgi:hypothetical protein
MVALATLECYGKFIPFWRTTMNRHETHPITHFDSIVTYQDGRGDSWSIGAEFKSFRGRLEISSLAIWPNGSPVPLTRRALRDLPLEDLFRSALAKEEAELKVRLSQLTSSTRHQGRPHSDDDLHAVADAYSVAFRARRPVQQAVADALGISKSTAAKRIMAARSRGFITDTDEEAPK